MNPIQGGAVGVPLVMQFTNAASVAALDISGYVTITCVWVDLGGNKVTKTATLYTDGKDGLAVYTTQAGDIPEGVNGSFEYQGIYTDATPRVWPSLPGSFPIKSNL